MAPSDSDRSTPRGYRPVLVKVELLEQLAKRWPPTDPNHIRDFEDTANVQTAILLLLDPAIAMAAREQLRSTQADRDRALEDLDRVTRRG